MENFNKLKIHGMNINPLNLIVAFSNITCLFPLALLYQKGDQMTFFILLFLSLASFSSHLIENHKHGMGNPEHFKQFSYFLNRMDVFGVVILSIRSMIIYIPVVFKLNLIDTIAIAIVLIIGFLSELDKTADTRVRFIVLHSIWHISAFLLIYRIIFLYYI